jgi:hypothetical protein
MVKYKTNGSLSGRKNKVATHEVSNDQGLAIENERFMLRRLGVEQKPILQAYKLNR